MEAARGCRNHTPIQATCTGWSEYARGRAGNAISELGASFSPLAIPSLCGHFENFSCVSPASSQNTTRVSVSSKAISRHRRRRTPPRSLSAPPHALSLPPRPLSLPHPLRRSFRSPSPPLCLTPSPTPAATSTSTRSPAEPLSRVIRGRRHRALQERRRRRSVL